MGIKVAVKGIILLIACVLFISNAVFGQQGSGPPQPPQAGQEAATPSAVQDSDEMSKGISVSQERISLDLKGIDVNELLRILSLKMGVTIVPTKSVAGRINIFLNNLTFEDALDVILLSQDLARDKSGNGVINVMTAAEYERLYGEKYNEKRKFKSVKLAYAKPSNVFNALGQVKSDIGKIIADETSGTIFLIDTPERLALEEKTIKELDQPLETEIFDIQYAKSADMKTQLSGAITTGTGELFVDERSSKVIVSDLPDKMKKLRRMVKALDAETPQVFIEAEILQVTLDNQYDRGINWEKLFSEEQWIKWARLFGLDFKAVFPIATSAASTYVQQVGFGNLSTHDKSTLLLKFLSQYGDTKVLSRPRIAALNNQEAKIMIATREPYSTATQSQAAGTSTITADNIQFVDVGVKLSVVPTINKDGFVTMKIKPEISSASSTPFTTTAGSKVPVVSTSEAETVVKVKDGTMIMIAGLMKDEKIDTIKGWPGISKVAILGAIFGNRAVQTKRTELIIFLTPHIIRGDKALQGVTPQDLMPPEMATKRTVQRIINEKIGKIGKNFSARDEAVKEKSDKAAFQDKLKGIKEFE